MAESLKEGYFHRVHRLTPTRLWINNPTIAEAKASIAAGAVSCTTNPTYASKMAKSETDKQRFQEAARKAEANGPASATEPGKASEVQRQLVQPIAELFRPLYEESHGTAGFVSIQGDPFSEDVADSIVRAASEDRALGPNIIAKVPVTEPGLEAIERLVAEDVPVIATEVMSISQVIAVCETYIRASHKSGHRPAFYVTHITGIFDEYLSGVVSRGGIAMEPDILLMAGTAVARKQIRIMRDRNYPGIFLGGGARHLHHFTEFIGEPVHVTVNWKGTAEVLVNDNPTVVPRGGCPVPDIFVDELLRHLPDFARAYAPDGLQPKEFKDFGPVVLFRRSFEAGWTELLDVLASC